MKVSIQEKFAELESRIRDLEIEASNNSGFAVRYSRTTSARKPFGEHWDKMWEHFDKFMSETSKSFWRDKP